MRQHRAPTASNDRDHPERPDRVGGAHFLCPPTDTVFLIGVAMNKNLTVKMGNCNHRRYHATLINLVLSGTLDPVKT